MRDVPTQRAGFLLAEVDISSGSSSSSSLMEMEHISFSSSPFFHDTVTQPSQGDGKEAALTLVQSKDGLRGELQDIKHTFCQP